MNNIKEKLNTNLYRWDWFILFSLMVGLFLTFQQSDLIITGRHGLIMAEGHIIDFYKYSSEVANSTPAYLPSTYFIFGIWNIPVAIINFISGISLMDYGYVATLFFLFWNKLCPIIFYFATGYYVYKIGIFLNFSQIRAKVMTYAFLSMPIALFSQFIFGQYDSFTMFFVLISVYAFLKEDKLKFLLYFGIAITFKYTALFLFVPLLLMRYKKVFEIIKNCIIFLIPLVTEFIMYSSFLLVSGPKDFTNSKIDYILGTELFNPYFSIEITLFLFVILCAFAYFYEIENSKLKEYWIFFYCNCSIFLLFGMSMWHPQWLLLAIPFWTISSFMHKKCDIYLWLDVFMMVFFTIFTVMHWEGFIDQELLRFGIFGFLTQYHTESYRSMASFIPFFSKNMAFTILSSLMAIHCIYKLPKFSYGTLQENRDFMGILRGRVLIGVAIFIIPCGLSFVSMTRSNSVIYNTTNDIKSSTSRITTRSTYANFLNAHRGRVYFIEEPTIINEGDIVKQTFCGTENINQILIRATTDVDNILNLSVSIKDLNNGEVVEKNYENLELKSNDLYIVFHFPYEVNSNHKYELSITFNKILAENFNIYTIERNTYNGSFYHNDEERENLLVMKMIE